MDDNKQLYEKQSNQYNPFFPIVRLEDIIETISDKSIQWILNNYNHIYVEYSESVAITRNKVPSLLRRNGLWISYNTGKDIVTEWYKGKNVNINDYNQWTDDANWAKFEPLADGKVTYQHLSHALKQLMGKGNTITNFPDEEDITTDGTVLSFKDREYDTNNFSGLGRVILRKNIILDDGVYKNVLTQDMINKPNTIYEIRYDFDLNGEEITIPEGCALDFQGGSFSNGIISNKESIFVKASNMKIFNEINIDANITTPINVMWFGAKGDGVTDDTTAIQSAIDSIKHEYNSMGNGTVYLPSPLNTYLISDTLILDEHWNTKIYSDVLIYGDRTSNRALLTWNGAEDKAMMSISKYSYNENLENISFNGSNIKGVIGLQIGEKDVQANGTKFSEYRNVSAINCEKGLVIGGQSSEVSPDDAYLSFYNCRFTNNKKCGIDVSGGNTGVSFYDLRMGVNGFDPTDGLTGCNIFIREGQINIFGYISGANAEKYPKTADIYQYYGGLRLYGAWSDTPGVFVNSGHSKWASIISSARHYEGSMTEENTPISIIWTGPQPLVLEGCSLYGSVRLDEGQGGSIIDIGTNFKSSFAKFEGNQINNQLGYSSIGNHNYIGKNINPEGLPSKVKSLIWSRKYDINQVKTIGEYTITDYINSDNNQYGILGNAYSDKTTGSHIAIKDGRCDRISFANGHFSFDTTSNGVAGQPISFINRFKTGEYYGGIYFSMMGRKIIWENNPPITNEWNAGDIAFTTNIEKGRPIGWMCVESGSPGKWVATGHFTDNRINRGTTAERPPMSSDSYGFQYFDTTLGKPIYWTGSKWVDANGSDV